jgi:hypothetical protein
MTTSNNEWEESWVDALTARLNAVRPKPIFRLAPRSELFHYTTANGLKGIVEDGCIWATAASYLNDASEIEYGAALLQDVFEQWETANKGNTESLAMSVLQTLRVLLTHPESHMERSGSIYLACFCEKGNLLSQWRTYGQTGGYAIGLSMFGSGLERIGSKFVGLKAEKDASYRTRLVRVIYDKNIQIGRLNSVLRDTLPLIDSPDIKDEVNSRGLRAKQVMLLTAITMVQNFLLEEIATFKNDAFIEEQEWRIVVRSKNLLGRITEMEGAGLYLRADRGMMVPYVKLVPTDGQLPIRSIRFGPSLDKSRAAFSVKLLMALHEYERVEILGSDIPVLL